MCVPKFTIQKMFLTKKMSENAAYSLHFVWKKSYLVDGG